MNEIVSPRVLLVADKRPKQFDDHIVPKMADLGITVIRTVEPSFKGSLEDIDAVLVMFQFCGRQQYDALRRQCAIAKVKFIILPQQTAGWLTTFAEHGLRVPGKPVHPAPLPVAPKPIAHPKAEAFETQEDEAEDPDEPETIVEPTEQAPGGTFGQALVRARKAGGHSQFDVGAVCEVPQPVVSRWERGHVIQREQYAKLLELFPALKDAPEPPFATRPGKRLPAASDHAVEPSKPTAEGVVKLVHAVEPAPLPEPMTLPIPPAKTNGHSHHRPPIESLLRAARAVGISGPIAITVDDSGTTVHVGGEAFPGAFDDAVEKARGVLVERLREQQRRAGELLAELAGAA